MVLRSKNAHWMMCDIRRRHELHVGYEHGTVSPDGRTTEAILDDLAERTAQKVAVVGCAAYL